MKPSNTGIRWFLYDDFRNACIDLENGRGSYEKIAEAAALIAIAEYRAELAAKAESVPRFAPIMKDGPVFSHYAMMDEYSGGGWVKLSDMRSLLNENDNAE